MTAPPLAQRTQPEQGRACRQHLAAGLQGGAAGQAPGRLENDETSDLAYNPVTGTLFTVTGKVPQLVELTRDGDVLRRIPLKGFSNPEGVAVLENGNVAVTDERRRSLSIFRLDPLTRELDVSQGDEFDLGFPDSGNKGFEGIAWDPAQGRLLLGKERTPEMFSLASDGSRHLEGALRPLPGYGLGMRNLSALSVDPRTGHLLVLSAQSNLLLELDETGEPVSFISLLGGLNGLAKRIPVPKAWPWTSAATSIWSASPTSSTYSASPTTSMAPSVADAIQLRLRRF